jgi:hypothetical protein
MGTRTGPRQGLGGAVNSAQLSEFFSVVYDLRDPGVWEAAHRDRASWGRLYTDIHALDYDHIALVFRPAPDERWRDWERVRLGWILGQNPESEVA